MVSSLWYMNPDSKVHGANMGPTWGRQDPGGPHIDPMNLANREVMMKLCDSLSIPGSHAIYKLSILI